MLTDIKPKWAFFRLPDPNSGEDRDCPWWADWSDEERPGWTPVTILRLN